MKTMTTMKIWLLTPIAALPRKPTRCPTSTWSMIPCKPPIMLVSMVGHASFHTADCSGPSMIERSKRRLAGAAGGMPGDIAPLAGADVAAEAVCAATTPSSDTGGERSRALRSVAVYSGSVMMGQDRHSGRAGTEESPERAIGYDGIHTLLTKRRTTTRS